MTIGVPSHLKDDDAAELNRLLTLIFKADDAAANRWLNDRSDYFGMPPVDMLRRDELGVVRVLSYLKDAAP